MKINEIIDPHASQLELPLQGGRTAPQDPFAQREHPDYLYHATSRDRLGGILAAGRMQTFRPWHGTDQQTWPDGSTEKRTYWGPSPGHVASFVPDFPAALVRARREHVNARPERGTGDFYTNKPVHARHLEYFDGENWNPLANLR